MNLMRLVILHFESAVLRLQLLLTWLANAVAVKHRMGGTLPQACSLVPREVAV